MESIVDPIEIRKFKVDNVVIHVETYLNARQASEELIYLVKNLQEEIKEITGINEIMSDVNQLELEVDEDNKGGTQGHHSEDRGTSTGS